MDPPYIIGMVDDPKMQNTMAVKRLHWHLVPVFLILVLNFLRCRSLIAILTAIPFGFESYFGTLLYLLLMRVKSLNGGSTSKSNRRLLKHAVPL
jgi:hypothetical protein